MNYVFKTHDHPQASGRKPGPEEFEYQQHFELEEKGHLTVRMGRKVALGVAAVVLRMLSDDIEMAKEAKALAKTIKKT